MARRNRNRGTSQAAPAQAAPEQAPVQAAEFDPVRGAEATSLDAGVEAMLAAAKAKEAPQEDEDKPEPSEIVDDLDPELLDEGDPDNSEPEATFTDDPTDFDVDVDDLEEAPAVVEPAADRIRVTLNGQEMELTAQQVADNVMMRSDYTAKTQEVAEQRRQLDQERLAVQNLQASLAQMREEGGVPPMPPAEMLQEGSDLYDPVGYMHAERRHRDAQAKLEQAARESEQSQAEQFAQLKEQNTAKIFQHIPEWKDQARQTAEMSALRKHLVSMGLDGAEFDKTFGKGEINYVVAKMARDSMILQQIRNKRNGGATTPAKRVVKKTVNVSSQPTNGGSPQQTRSQRQAADAFKALQSRDSLDPIGDAVRYQIARAKAKKGAQRRA